jgi:hypothetical protein
MEHDCIAHGLIPTTIDWPERARTYIYAHGGTINPEDGTLVPGYQIRVIAARLVELIRMTVEGTFVPDRERERDKLSAAIGTKEHGGVAEAKVQFHGNFHGVTKLTPIKVTKGLRTNNHDNQESCKIE